MTKSNESAENYLETILILSHKKPVVRSVDIADELGFKKSSVSVAMKNLREKEMITVRPEGYIYLTDKGRQVAEMIYERHQFLSAWLMALGVDETTAVDDACRIEHVISPESLVLRNSKPPPLKAAGISIFISDIVHALFTEGIFYVVVFQVLKRHILQRQVELMIDAVNHTGLKRTRDAGKLTARSRLLILHMI